MKTVLPWIVGLCTVGLVAGAAWVGVTYLPPPVPAAQRAGVPDPFAPPDRAPLKPDHDYVVLIRAIEVAPKGPGDKTWERGFDDGPDLAYDLSWRGNVIFSSDVKEDTLIGRWEAVNVDVWDSVQNGGNVDLGQALNNGAVVRTPALPEEGGGLKDISDGMLTVRVWDSDLFDNDEAGEVTLLMSDLTEGDSELRFSVDQAGAIRRISVRVTDREVPVRNLIEMLRAP
ncbi:hypothetical protein [Alienimonas chondri]|uniref:Uncharacterized protein n=1 Tax=Alienimonas chondri TaxID=2681879 RepID=A0ABX1VD85_9PLAN|nr:hypothetical protein [Alienimonas chondri]NNJ26068.1 hypothetical protein [Alienimonas chondri]